MISDKTKVYNGYEEMFLTGAALKERFHKEFYATGRHHDDITAIKIPDYLELKGIVEEQQYRIFVNDYFCRVMDAETDKPKCFFAHAKPERIELLPGYSLEGMKPICPDCGMRLRIVFGAYGEFLGCTGYPVCKYKTRFPVIGHHIPKFHNEGVTNEHR